MSLQYKEQFQEALKQLGHYLQQGDEKLEIAKYRATATNSWFTPKEIEKSLKSLSLMLIANDLQNWFRHITPTDKPKNTGLILAGNIPAVGFHDILCVLSCGHIAQIKMSSSDDKLLPVILDELCSYLPPLKEKIIYTEQLKDFEAVIATGSNNSSRYFEYYFGKVPHIIRKNRNSVAVLTGNESTEEIKLLGYDIFDYFGMGCRNISKVFLPKGYNIKRLFEPLEQFKEVINHHKYHNNYDYHKSIYLVNQTPHFDNGFLLLKEDTGLNSPLAVLFYEYYDTLEELTAQITAQNELIQCIVGNVELDYQQIVAFGQSQYPRLWDYADNINTVAFLNNLS